MGMYNISMLYVNNFFDFAAEYNHILLKQRTITK